MRRKLCGRHNFKPTGVGVNERCTDCGALFPCDPRNGECGHHDCIEVRGVLPICPVCKKHIKPEDYFGVSPPGRSSDLGFLPVHRFCVDEVPETLVIESTATDVAAGAHVAVVDHLSEAYRNQYGDLVDELVVTGVVDDSRVTVKWIGIVPLSHLRMK